MFMQKKDDMPGLPQTFPQSAHLFSEIEVNLQTLPEYDSLVLVVNGPKSITLLNWVQAKEIQTWRSASTNLRVSGCISGDNIVILEYEVGSRSAIRSYILKQSSPSCEQADGFFCNEDRRIIGACKPGHSLQTSKNDADSCPQTCPTGKFAYLGEVCVHCHKSCLDCSGKIFNQT